MIGLSECDNRNYEYVDCKLKEIECESFLSFFMYGDKEYVTIDEVM